MRILEGKLHAAENDLDRAEKERLARLENLLSKATQVWSAAPWAHEGFLYETYDFRALLCAMYP